MGGGGGGGGLLQITILTFSKTLLDTQLKHRTKWVMYHSLNIKHKGTFAQLIMHED